MEAIEFEVMGVERLSGSASGYQKVKETPYSGMLKRQRLRATFVLKAPKVDDIASTIKYTGFDWFSLVKYWATVNNGYTASSAQTTQTAQPQLLISGVRIV